MAVAVKITAQELTRCTDTLLSQLPVEVDETIKYLANDYKIPKWQIVCGVLMEAQLGGRLSAFMLDPSWQDGFKQALGICKQCKKPFKPVRLGQLFCTEACGTAQMMKENPSLITHVENSRNVINDANITDRTDGTSNSSIGNNTSDSGGWSEVSA